MSDEQKNMSLIEVVKRNGDFRKNYGIAIGAFLFLRSLSAARGGTTFWNALAAIVTAAFAAVLHNGWRVPL
ncbi:hypothetical protein [Bradyrhizobium mercantei]|uniref:hypothetical protein n=1 Tax=Bradyrhizobium mercantei TaxID=1904807 RepID=UPI000976B424|nr:hypothetical protein [Bradyrhizobium mercantei]